MLLYFYFYNKYTYLYIFEIHLGSKRNSSTKNTPRRRKKDNRIRTTGANPI